MDRPTQLALARRLLDHVTRRSTDLGERVYHNPVWDYTCPEQAALEVQRFFREGPVIVALGADLREPGDHVADALTGVPILLVRGADGRLRGFLNMCRHRGTRLAVGRDRSPGRFRCPYHGWTYDLEGRVIGVPSRDCFEDAGAGAIEGLIALPVVERHGLVWVCPAPTAQPDVDALLGALGPELEAYRLDRYYRHATRVLARRMNWKLVIDTFLEAYHIPALHKDTIGPMFHGNVATFDAFGPSLRTVFARRTIDELSEQDEADWSVLSRVAIIYLVFPSTVLLWLGDHMEVWRVCPGPSVEESVMEFSLYAPEAARTEEERRHWDRNMELALRTVELEDFPLGEDIQQGFRVAAERSVVYGRNEVALTHFHRAVRERLGLASASDG
jgi:phenylpropionate dioxygenase-like ring-hydroxylating dioxygenase large terminal subunit